MISDHQGGLLAADVDALVNAVNTVGAMDKGIVLGSSPSHARLQAPP
ncbi:MAG: hypothetical protein MUF44_11090 [Hydrogenophaga sp.]|nr:hypothetical protein [Hydrogenophaga sp.]